MCNDPARFFHGQLAMAALWATAAGRADGAVGQAGLSVAAGIVMWAGSYFIGLSSPLPDDARPTLIG